MSLPLTNALVHVRQATMECDHAMDIATHWDQPMREAFLRRASEALKTAEMMLRNAKEVV